MVMGAVMLGGIITGKPTGGPGPVTRWRTPDERIQRVCAASSSPKTTVKDVIEQIKKDPGSVRGWWFARQH